MASSTMSRRSFITGAAAGSAVVAACGIAAGAPAAQADEDLGARCAEGGIFHLLEERDAARGKLYNV